MRALAIAPHPDDADISCGGTVAQWVRDGAEVAYVICSSGDKGTDDPKMSPAELARIRRREQEEAALTLGVREVTFLNHPDGAMEDNHVLRGQIVREIRRYRPDLVLTCDPYRRYMSHRDHRVTGTVVLDAVYPFARDPLFYPEHRAEGFQPYKVREVYLWGTEEPDVFIDIRDTFDLKLAALACHRSQLRSRTREEFEGRMREYAAMLGQPKDLPLAEAFHRVEFRW